MEEPIEAGTERVIEGRLRVFYDGYWIKAYPVPADTLLEKRRLIEALTRRLFNHVEHGINVPGERLDEARAAYDTEAVAERKRVKAAMLAGALFNRAADIFQKLVELQKLGVIVKSDNPLMRQCGQHLTEALELGKMVLHRSGDEGIDELWGEPFKAFAFPIEEFYKSRYVKIALTMRTIDRLAKELGDALGAWPVFAGIEPLVQAYAEAAKTKCETLRTDADVFETWTTFVVAGEHLSSFEPTWTSTPTPLESELAMVGRSLARRGKELIADMARARVPMPKSTADLVDALAQHRAFCAAATTRRSAVGSSDPPRLAAPHVPARG
ncbi:MAG TPA: hypothetical protein VMI54_13160 [Polyangiaceae bacterium]|nr:hypothetical protein [Polyangiaceae bacterium]